ncbi:ribosome maturation factor RimP [Tepidimicrobium xylanilyticum]|uniref:Ribosome maturation factor RimP n=1 Tax=Tepidimicrobium xylanilyticum TaxID=1123352 RepID=A0A1H2YBJ2_9FIRM|nr:ribosome maturation factor RimP [Tepidimicrobium xylanilyticum]GMG97099.1 ribosome maturation factor RimP [Tepidimicrobium xylanilyticum]SDX02593.1 ribosome maturation factor RimP [Tepidimicrobium xylanilyticum]
MSRKNIIKTVREHCEPIIEELGYDLVDLEYVKENGRNFLRFYIGKPEGISIDDCQKVSEVISDKLDEIDPIESSYYLEVSSPGLDRPLKTDKDLKRNIGRNVEISLYKNIDGRKKFYGILLGYTETHITIEEENGIERNIEREAISNIKLTVEF